ncbi:MAG: dihydrofolate reductase [Candidatus Doudnabacteria bacterium]|nr:dihydrofolate reductase [Candidatus Doudnabacteria bacterium]
MIALIAAIAENNVIGAKNDLPWYLPEDLKRFKELTLGKVVVMGRKTYDSIIARLKKPLPGRTSVVISRQDLKLPPGVELFHSIDEALRAHQSQDVFIIGGEQIFNQSLSLADTLYITRVEKSFPGDAFFPDIDENVWQKISNDPHDGFSFIIYKRNF